MSHTLLQDYFDTLEHTLLTQPSLYVEQFTITLLTPERANIRLWIRLKLTHLLSISEALVVSNDQLTSLDYRYHFQDPAHQLIFRYDSTPHFPNLPTFPHHKYLPDTVIATSKPTLDAVIQEAINALAAI